MNGHTRVWRHVAVIAALVSMAVPAHAQQKQWVGALQGTNEVPPNASTATGWADIFLSGPFLTVNVIWQGLLGGNPGAAHIHCCTAPGSNIGVAIPFINFPVTTGGTYNRMFDLRDPTDYSNLFLATFGGPAGAEAALIAGLDAGNAYVDIHNGTYPGGEIRANIVVATPEPASLALVATGLLAIVGAGWSRRRTS